MTKKLKRAVSAKKFDSITPLLVSIVADVCLDEKFPTCTKHQREWFGVFADWWVRFHYSNTPRWKKEIDGDDGGRDLAYAFVGQWAEAFAKNPDQYMQRHREANKATADPEWKDGRILAG